MTKLISKGELEVKNWLEKHNIRYEFQKRFKDCKDKHSLPFDFYLPDYNVAIEYQGKQHFEVLNFSTKKDSKEIFLKQFKKQQLHDKIKYKYCQSNDIYLIMIIYDENVEKVMNFEYQNFKKRYVKDDDFDFKVPNVKFQGNVFKRLSIEITGTRYCEVCGKEFKPKILSNGLISDETICSKKCSKERTKIRNLKKYGYESHNQSSEIKAKQQKACLEKYGTKNAGSRPEAIEKAHKTCLEKYGVKNGSQSKEARKKISQAVTKRVFTIEMNDLLKKLYLKDNLRVCDIAKQFDIPYGTIVKQINKLGLHRSGGKLISESKIKYHITKEELENLKKQGFKYKEIMKITGLSESTLGRKLKEFGLIDFKKSLTTNNVTYTNETWIEKAKSTHGDLYDYSLIDYKNSKTNVKIICKRCGRIFEQNPNHHLQGRGCKYCNNSKKVS